MGISGRAATGWAVVIVVAAGCAQGVPGGSGGVTFGSGQVSASATASASSSVSASASDGTATGDEATAGETSADGSEGAASSAGDASASASASATADGSSGGPGECGNGIVDGSESCDGDDLGGQSCADYGYDDGVLICDAECNHLTEGCYSCGDGEKALGEACDGNDFGGDTCVGLGYGGGNLSCSADCMMVVESGCTALPSCGDGMLNGGEQCDGAQLGGATCVTQGFDLGNLTCTAQCTFNTSQCMDDIANCGQQGDFCVFDENDPQSTCCPAGVGGNVLGICDIFACI